MLTGSSEAWGRPTRAGEPRGPRGLRAGVYLGTIPAPGAGVTGQTAMRSRAASSRWSGGGRALLMGPPRLLAVGRLTFSLINILLFLNIFKFYLILMLMSVRTALTWSPDGHDTHVPGQFSWPRAALHNAEGACEGQVVGGKCVPGPGGPPPGGRGGLTQRSQRWTHGRNVAARGPSLPGLRGQHNAFPRVLLDANLIGFTVRSFCSHPRMCLLMCLEREEGGGREGGRKASVGERNVDQSCPVRILIGDRTHRSWVCDDARPPGTSTPSSTAAATPAIGAQARFLRVVSALASCSVR